VTFVGVPMAVLATTLLAGPGPGGRIEIESDSRLVLPTPGVSVALRIRSLEEPTLRVSVGAVRSVTRVSDGLFETIYTPPSEPVPQIAFVVARSAHGFGWLALPLGGASEVTVGPGPGGKATVTVGDRQFGPQAVGPDGKATIRVVVPPGTRYAVSGGKRIGLNLPEVPHIYLTVDDAPLPANVNGIVGLHILAVTPEGRPRSGAPIGLSVSPGTVSAAHEVEPGVYEASWILPPSAVATVEARLKDEPTLLRATMPRSNLEPRRLRIDVDRPSVSAGDGAFDFTVAVEDAYGNPVPNASPQASVDGGTFLGFTPGPAGRWVGRVMVPEHLEGKGLVIVATVGNLLARREVDLVPGPADQVELEGEAPSGEKGGPLSFRILDRFGNLTDANPPEVVASAGSVGASVRQGPGAYRVNYAPPAATRGDHDVVRVIAGLAERTITIQLSREETDLGHLEFGPLGGVSLSGGTAAPVFGAEAALFTGGRPPQFGLSLYGGWFKFSRHEAVSLGAGSEGFTSDAAYLVFTAAPTLRLAVGRRAILSISAGAGAVRVESTSMLADQPSFEASKWMAAGTAAVSLGVRLWRGYPFVELRGLYVSDPHLTGLSGSFVPLLLQLGYRFDAF